MTHLNESITRNSPIKGLSNLLFPKLSLLTLAASLSLASCSPGKPAAQSCHIDTDCPGQALCLENYCQTGCNTDADCPGEQVCENNICTNSPMNDQDIPAGSFGKCIEVEMMPGYKTCVMDTPQIRMSSSMQLHQPLSGPLPGKIDHRNYLLNTNCSAVHNQGICGWCTAHSTTAAIEAIECAALDASERISEPDLWYLGRKSFLGLSDLTDCKGGWAIESAVKTAKKYKLLPEWVWPYDDKMPTKMLEGKPGDNVIARWGEYTIDNFELIGDHNSTALKQALAEGYNVVYALPLFCGTGWNWTDKPYAEKKIISPQVDTISNCGADSCDPVEITYCSLGTHTVLIVGYDDETKQFSLRNSWGSSWHDQGYSSLAYEYIDKFGYGGVAPKKCLPHFMKTCSDGDVYSQNGCGKLEEKIQDCTTNQYCEQGECKEQNQNCTPHVSQTCFSNAVYYVDSCGNREQTAAQNCVNEGKECKNNQCVKTMPSSARFQDLGDGTVRDNLYLRVWQKVSSDSQFNLISEAQTHCDTLTLTGRIWRVPVRTDDLRSLYTDLRVNSRSCHTPEEFEGPCGVYGAFSNADRICADNFDIFDYRNGNYGQKLCNDRVYIRCVSSP